MLLFLIVNFAWPIWNVTWHWSSLAVWSSQSVLGKPQTKQTQSSCPYIPQQVLAIQRYLEPCLEGYSLVLLVVVDIAPCCGRTGRESSLCYLSVIRGTIYYHQVSCGLVQAAMRCCFSCLSAGGLLLLRATFCPIIPYQYVNNIILLHFRDWFIL